MRFKISIVLAAGCIGLAALSMPATAKPTPRALERDHRADTVRAAQMRHVRQVRYRLRRAAQPVNARAGERLPAQATPVALHSAKPRFGWPALVTEARKYIGTNPTARSRLWCATFMNFVLAKVGYAGTGSDAAKSFASYGRRIYEPRVGAIAVLTRGKRGGHVGVVTGLDPRGNPIIISGNHGHRVGEGVYSRNRVIAYVMPAGAPLTATRLASASPVAPVSRASDADSEGGVPSPIEELLAAINSENPRNARAQAPAAPQRPELQESQEPQVPQTPQRIVQQTPDQPGVRYAQQMSAQRQAEQRQINRQADRRAQSGGHPMARQAVQPAPHQAPQPHAVARRDLPLDPAIARMLGIRERDGYKKIPAANARAQAPAKVQVQRPAAAKPAQKPVQVKKPLR